jgi:hypothetical protein
MRIILSIFLHIKSILKIFIDLIFGINPSPEKVIARAAYIVLLLDCFYLGVAFLEISGVTTGQDKLFKFASPRGEDLKTHIDFLWNINLIVFSILGGKQIAQILVIIAAIRTGANVESVLSALSEQKKTEIETDELDKIQL